MSGIKDQNHDIIDQLTNKLKDICMDKDLNISKDTEIYYDLGIYGEDFDQFLEWIKSEYNVDFSFMKPAYYPNEPGVLFPWLQRLMHGRRPYKSMTVYDILRAIETGKWTEK